jgi:hypothetical protein
METMTVLKETSERLRIPKETLLRESFASYLRERKRALMAERFEMLSRYGVNSPEQLKEKIEEGEIPEHPTWEDYIELANLEDDLGRLEDDLRSLYPEASLG